MRAGHTLASDNTSYATTNPHEYGVTTVPVQIRQRTMGYLHELILRVWCLVLVRMKLLAQPLVGLAYIGLRSRLVH